MRVEKQILRLPLILMFSKSFTYFFFLLSLVNSVPFFAQNNACDYRLIGVVEDEGTVLPLSEVNVFIEKHDKGAVTDSSGYFSIEGLCADEYHIVLSHIGCTPHEAYINLESDTFIRVHLAHTANELEGVVIQAQSSAKTAQSIQQIGQQTISDRANLQLSQLLESITGVSSLKSGSGVSKPIVHGLYGNRITILNNGIAQSGQTWGDDHSPEIDPLVANKIQVVKGVGALAYPGAKLGSVVIIEPQKIGTDPHLHGKFNYFFESNGLGHGAHLMAKQYRPALAWKLNATFKRSGDKRTSSYYLANTGLQEANVALQLEKSFNDKLFNELYFSSFNTIIGVLRGAHIGNLTDLAFALEREVPYFTKDHFTYQIAPPRQKVNHHLLKLRSQYFLDDLRSFTFTFATQINDRKEFDVRRSGQSDRPVLSLYQLNFYGETKYQQEWYSGFTLNTGVQFNMIDNVNVPGTGIYPLIPDYISYETAFYVLAQQQLEQWFFEAAVRMNQQLQNVLVRPRTYLDESQRFQNNYFNQSASLGVNYRFSPSYLLSWNMGIAMRNPAINELYSDGVHQGSSAIEEGNIDLLSERSLKSSINLSGQTDRLLSFEVLAFAQAINNYIFLNPQDQIRLTIRGAFPVFAYEQTNALLFGTDLSTNFQFTESFKAQILYSFLRGNNRSEQLPLIDMPPNNLSGKLSYAFSKPIHFKKRNLENFTIELDNKYVFEQTHFVEGQDFIAPPPAYWLTDLKISGDMQWSSTRMRMHAGVQNLFNVRYRDYLNRQRYFADDLGINFTIGWSLNF